VKRKGNKCKVAALGRALKRHLHVVNLSQSSAQARRVLCACNPTQHDYAFQIAGASAVLHLLLYTGGKIYQIAQAHAVASKEAREETVRHREHGMAARVLLLRKASYGVSAHAYRRERGQFRASRTISLAWILSRASQVNSLGTSLALAIPSRYRSAAGASLRAAAPLMATLNDPERLRSKTLAWRARRTRVRLTNVEDRRVRSHELVDDVTVAETLRELALGRRLHHSVGAIQDAL
jgi:hypothetical protein